MYRQSVLGVIWAFIPPIVTAFFWIFLKSQNVFNLPDSSISYPVFVFTGIILWQIFLDALTLPLKVVEQSKAMLIKVNFPREAILLSALYEVFFNALIKIGLLSIVYLILGVQLGFSHLTGIVGILVLVFLGFCVSLVLVPISMLYGDIQRAIGVIMQFMFFLTPIIYPLPSHGLLMQIGRYNPIGLTLDHTRNLLATGITSFDYSFLLVPVAVFFIFMIGLVLYRLSLPFLIERTG